MSALACDLPVMRLAAMIRQLENALRDGTWKQSPVGHEVVSYIRTLRWAHAADNTIKAYEPVLALLAARHADWGGLEEFCNPAGTEYIRAFLDAEWGGASASTKKQRTAIVRAFFQWAALDHRIPYDPSQTIKAPKASRRAARQAYDLTVLHKLVAAQDNLRDQCALELLCRLGLRRCELRLVTVGEIDLVRGYVYVHGKGAKDELLPLPPGMQQSFYLHVQGDCRSPREYLLYARERRTRPMSLAGVHNWFKRCVREAGLSEQMTMHELRHSAADALRRERGDVSLAQQLLRHESLATTEAYLHPTKRDLADALEAMEQVWGSASV